MFARSPDSTPRSTRGAGLLVLAALAAPACLTPTEFREDPAETRGSLELLERVQPADIAVAPIRDQTNAQRVPGELFRTAFVDALVARRYSPLSLAYVDGNWVESSFRGTPPPDALLVVAVTRWDPSHLYSTGAVSAAADVVLFEGGDTTGKVLWQITLERSIDLGDGRGHPPAPGQDLIPRAVRLFAREALAELPVRDPIAAHP